MNLLASHRVCTADRCKDLLNTSSSFPRAHHALLGIGQSERSNRLQTGSSQFILFLSSAFLTRSLFPILLPSFLSFLPPQFFTLVLPHPPFIHACLPVVPLFAGTDCMSSLSLFHSCVALDADILTRHGWAGVPAWLLQTLVPESSCRHGLLRPLGKETAVRSLAHWQSVFLTLQETVK